MAWPIDHSQKISQLLSNVEKETFSSSKFDGYYKVTKLQIQSGLTSEAKVSYNKADEIRRSSRFNDTITHILKLVKLSLVLNPDQRPDLLAEAEERAQKLAKWLITNDVRTHGTTYITPFLQLAGCLYGLKNSPVGNPSDKNKADQYLVDAINRLNRDGDCIKYLKSYKKIIKICTKQNEKQYFLYIVPNVESNLQKLSFYAKSNICLFWRLQMSELAYKIDRHCGKTLLAFAKEFLDLNHENLLKHNDFIDLTSKYQTLEQMMQ